MGYKWNTLLSYNAAARKFMKYKIAVKETRFVFPILAGDLYGFCYWAGKNIDEYDEQDVCAKTLAKYLYGIQAWHLYHSVEYPAESKDRITVLLQASAHADAESPPRPVKAPVTMAQLVALTDHLVSGDDQSKAVLDLAIVAFWGMARLAEVTYDCATGPLQRTASLMTTDVRFVETQSSTVVELTIRGAKTCSPGESQKILLHSMAHMLCPVMAVKRRLGEARNEDISLFGHGNGLRGRSHLTKSSVRKVLSSSWNRLGFPNLTGHLFRVGGASLHCALGVPVAEICRLGRWTSGCYKLYLRVYQEEDVLLL
ncbi:uncharacterized protein PGTG_22332 [Puccinia graminis f. sp. tritici CRL 75-36-700-3]|uniref:Tyr recombinase domain-containing protein n=1 Tax=Puccinia graminis f. sp. tritici (strain CRL 75-36-700-3 / race SCCL) TaxID=418459 RepID=H6QU81_PUCGT|nr:uncharacterized protein PGTG_22332 [Puccinia graminis f. sp. tritici CRL 75-36-700-3]EHS64544.1 hypothetical protein PGTG_22332 [Puccinia graminis f. sp. tritici CRL 75-36-700-3]